MAAAKLSTPISKMGSPAGPTSRLGQTRMAVRTSLR
jgi:hypothetical protein